LNATYAKGVSGRTQQEATASDVPLSRQFAEPEFNKLDLDFHFNQPLPQGLQAAFVARGQTSFGRALMRAEQFSLDGLDGVSGYPTGTFTTDAGVTLRSELSRSFSVSYVALSPYVFAAGGRGYDTKPTAVEQRNINVGAAGLGLRGASLYQSVFAVELARQFSDITGLHEEFRVDASIGMRF
jgi:hemolysin activation/secretion protein